jgi:hypothetical protein
MKRKLMLLVLALPLLGGCILYGDDDYYHRGHYWHDRDGHDHDWRDHDRR